MILGQQEKPRTGSFFLVSIDQSLEGIDSEH